MSYTVGSFVSLQQCNVYSPGCPGCNGCLSCMGNQYNAMDDGRACSAGYGYADNPLEERTVTAPRTMHLKHPATRTVRSVEISAMRPVADTANDEAHVTSLNACPPGYRMYAGRCVRRLNGARVANPVDQPACPPGQFWNGTVCSVPPISAYIPPAPGPGAPQKARLPGRMPRGVSRGLTTVPRPSMRPAPMGFTAPPRGPTQVACQDSACGQCGG